MTIKGSLDTSQWTAMLDQLVGPARTSLARSMAVAGGTVLRDEAQLLAPRASGKLAESIYLAYRDKESTESVVAYRVSWNSKTAPHGHLQEFGHWRYNKIVNGYSQRSLAPGKTKGKGPADHVPPGALDTPVWVPAHPFLRPAFDSGEERAKQAMIARGRVRLPELLAGKGGGESEA